MEKIDFRDWEDFPKIYTKDLKTVYVDGIRYKGKTVLVGDTLIWADNQGNELKSFVVTKISIYPHVEVFSEGSGPMIIERCIKK